MRPAIDAHIEPCPICGGRVEYYNDHSGMLGCSGYCGYGMVYDGPKSLEYHNFLYQTVKEAGRI